MAGWLPLVSSIDPATTAWVNKVNALAGSSVVGATRQTLVNTLIVGLKADGVFTGMDGIFVHAFADENQNEGLVSLVNPATVVAVPHANGGTFTLDANGWTGDGTKSYLASSLTPGVLNFTTGNAMFGSAILNNRTTFSPAISFGSFNSVTEILLIPLGDSSNVVTFELNGSTYPHPVNTSAKGFWVVSRSSGSIINLYQNAVGLNVGVSDAEGTNNAIEFYIGAENRNGTPSNFSSDNIVATIVGASKSLTGVANLSNRINTALGNLPTPKSVY